MTPGMPELLVALEGCQLLVFKGAVETMALQVPVGAGVVDEDGLAGEFGEGEGLIVNLPDPGVKGGGVTVEQEEDGGVADGVLDDCLVDEIVPVVRLGEFAAVSAFAAVAMCSVFRGSFGLAAFFGADADDPGFGFPGRRVAMFEAAFYGPIVI